MSDDGFVVLARGKAEIGEISLSNIVRLNTVSSNSGEGIYVGYRWFDAREAAGCYRGNTGRDTNPRLAERSDTRRRRATPPRPPPAFRTVPVCSLGRATACPVA